MQLFTELSKLGLATATVTYTLQATAWLKLVTQGSALSMSRCLGLSQPYALNAHQGPSAFVISLWTGLGLSPADVWKITQAIKNSDSQSKVESAHR